MKSTSYTFPKISLDQTDRRDDIMVYAVDLAQFHNWLGFNNTGKSLLPIIRQQSSFIKDAYARINAYYYKTDDIIPSAEWYLDNYYLIDDLITGLLKDISQEFETKLSYLAGGDLAGYTRVYLLVSEFVKNNENELDFAVLRQFVARYQTESPLSSAEIWAIPIMLKLIMLERIFYQVERILYIQKEREFAEKWINSVLGQRNKEVDLSQDELDLSRTFSAVYIERVARRLKEHGTEAKVLLNWLDNVASKQNLTVEKVIASEHHYLTSHGVLMGNIITAIKAINSQNWSEFFEGVSLVQQILLNDPAGAFSRMDFDSRDKYRHEIEFLAGRFNVSEIAVAHTLEKLAQQSQESPRNHVGFYLLGQGRLQLEKELTNNWGKVRQSYQDLRSFHKKYPTLSYLGSIMLSTIIAAFLFIWMVQTKSGNAFFGANLLAVIASLMLINGMAVYTVNRAFCQIIPASFLPKLDFSEGIPDGNKTIVIVPAIFNSSEKLIQQLKQLEIHYLNNTEKNIYFALLGDFTDSDSETLPDDQKIVEAGIKEIQRLNKKYGEDKFFYFHRYRQWNECERCWMGWERKRGKLIEFNRLLLNDGETSYFVKAGKIELLEDVKYIITLDADTILPRNSARKLIGTIAHPMQEAKIDTDIKKVLSGYGLIQPRIGLTAESAFSTPFSTMSTGTAGIDPYTCAISDIYQDLFGEGIFTGKGIYDLKAFHTITKDTFPENCILSHDLIEGLHARTGLATDIELFDGYPTKYLAYTKRTHRWIRGDWQIARYIFSKELSLISRWKIVDNLRRSLEAPLQFLLLLLAFTSLHRIFGLILGLFVLSLMLPMLISIGGKILDRSLTVRIAKYELRLGLSQVLFAIAVLPYQTFIQIDAIIRSLGRQLITKRSLLEWEPAADSERCLELTSNAFYRRMYPGLALSLLFVLGFSYVNVFTGIVLTLLILSWLCSPFIAYLLSLPYPENIKDMTDEDRAQLRKWARQVWAYFDLFVNEENNYLPPDNIQFEPYKGVAHRTSPTNIGLALLSNLAAEDLGYLSKKMMLKRVRNTLSTIRKMGKWNGHIYNWYNTHNLEPLYPIYISTVDNGNFATYLIALKNGVAEFRKRPLIEPSFLNGLNDTYQLIEVDENSDGQVEMDEFSKELETLIAKEGKWELKESYDFVAKWHNRLSGLVTDIEEIKDKNIKATDADFWMAALFRMLEDFKMALELYYPYVQAASVPESLQHLQKLNVRSLIREYVRILKDHSKTIPSQSIPYIRKALKNVVLTVLWSRILEIELKNIAYGMNFRPLFDKDKQLFSIGYNLSEQRLDQSYYDLLASEARQTSLFAIAKGDVSQAHWFKLSRPLTRIGGQRCLVAWSGTMFEFLMPLILFKNFRGTLMYETYKSVVKIQRAYAKNGKAPWGISESGYFSFDIQTNYQYKAFGVPGLGLKRGLARDMVISPYSTFMALAVDFQSSMANLKLMKGKGFNGVYGLYEAIDFTKARVPYNEEFSIVKSYMSHHQGMSFISLNNILGNNRMQERFHREPVIKSIELLLQEQVPLKEYTFNPNIEELSEEKVPAISRKLAEKPVIYLTPDTRMPRTSFISNREYAVMLTLSGSGYSQFNDIHVSRWREDPTLDMYGTFIYVQNLNSGNVWSTTAKPLDYPGEDYKVTCFPNTVKYSRKDGNIITQMEVFVTPEDPVEVRKVSLTNQSDHSRDLQLTSYLEVVLDSLKADIAHPTFSKLFIQIRYENDTLIAFRRPRQHDKKKLFAMHTCFVEGEMLGEVEYESDRTKFIGRGRTLSDPKAMDFNQPLSNSVGAILDPIMSLRTRIRVNPGNTVVVYFLTGVGDSKKSVHQLSEKYRSLHMINQARELSWSQNLMELTNLDLSFEDANRISSLASQVIYPGPVRRSINIKNNQRGQSSLWPYGISGDLPIVLLKIQDNNHLKLVDQLLKIHEYWKIKGLFIDLVILNEDKTGYFQTIQEMIHEKIGISHVRKLVNKPGGVFLLKRDQLPNDMILLLLHTVARIIFSGENGSLNNQILKYVRLAEQIVSSEEARDKKSTERESPESQSFSTRDYRKNLLFYNGYGGFTEDGKEYVIIHENEQTTPLPWVNVLANPRFGTLVTEAGSSYSWSQNSREHKLTPWSNDPLLDMSGEALYLRDERTGKFWSPAPQPFQDKGRYITRHGQGYSRFEHERNGLKQETTVYVSLDKNLKVVKLKLTNLTNSLKTLSAYYYVEWVLGVNRQENAPYLFTEIQDNVILCKNVYQEEFFGRVAFLSSMGGNNKSFTTDRKDFLGINRSLQNPIGLEKEKLSEKTGNGIDPCAVIQTEVVVNPTEEKTLYFLMGDEASKEDALALLKSVQDTSILEASYQKVVEYWDNLLSTIQIKTPEPTLDLLFNRWLIYQTLVCRIWARSAFYQSGGAFGYRDQLQDVMSLSILKPEIARNQIILHSSRQFPEGDVQHWWHQEKGKGIRTKFSDDLLWLPYVTADYIQHTGDTSVLDEQTPYLNQARLDEEEDERYAIPMVTDHYASVYEHCVRAIDNSLKFGEHGLPLIGTGDWNDGFSAIGREGKGESVWLGWFLLSTLKSFIPLCQERQDIERVQRYQEVVERLIYNIEKNAWDGAWYRRAYYDDGTPLGSVSNLECQIDAIAQSWAVISESAKESRVRDAMLAMERYLWDKEEGILKLFTPPFDKTENNPGYIRGYIPGVRENGGQYTHGAIWAVLALTKMGEGDKAMELFNMLNPINHSRTNTEVAKYKVEPYVMAADVYAVQPNVGRGGWTWYTGAAGWMYQVAIEGILGIKINNDKLTLTPCVPDHWQEYSITYRYKSANYSIRVYLKHQDKQSIEVDGNKLDSFPVVLKDDGQSHTIEIFS